MDTLAKRRAPGSLLGHSRHGLPARAETDAAAAPVAGGTIVAARDGCRLLLREIDRADVAALQRGFAALTPDEIRMRFLHPMNELPDALARSFCEIDPAHAVAFVLIDPPPATEPEIHAVARAYIDPVTLSAEFALVVQHALAGQGFGTLLMQRLMAACRERGATEIWGDVLNENGAMLELCDHLGFERHAVYHDPGIIRVARTLET